MIKIMLKKAASALMAAAVVISAVSVCTACGKAGGGGAYVEGELTDILAKIYAGADVDSETKDFIEGCMADVITEENAQSFLGEAEVKYTEGIFSVPMMSSVAYQCVLLRVNPDEVETVKKNLIDNADLEKWVCVTAETAVAENIGDLVLFVMCDKYLADAITASFKSLKN